MVGSSAGEPRITRPKELALKSQSYSHNLPYLTPHYILEVEGQETQIRRKKLFSITSKKDPGLESPDCYSSCLVLRMNVPNPWITLESA